MNEALAQNKFFKAWRITERVTRITGLAMECCYLIEGEERALLIDGLTGVGSLRAFVRELTELPVTAALTHAHMDHSGIAWESDSVYLHPDDLFLLYSDTDQSREQRLDFVNLFRRMGIPGRTTPKLADVLEQHPVRTFPIYDGDHSALGGVTVEVIAVPGHTRGTVVFLDRRDRIVFSGDACNANTLLNLTGSTSIAEYREGLLHLKSFEDAYDEMWAGHDHTALPKKIVDDGIALCERILARTDDAIETEDAFGGKSLLAAARSEGFRTKCGSLCNIVYKPETICKSVRPIL